MAYIFHFALQLSGEKFAQFSEQDKMVLLLMCDSALAINNASLTGQCLEVYMRLQDNFNELGLYEEIAYASSSHGYHTAKAREKCPVCDELIHAINDSTLAQCEAGHFWGKKIFFTRFIGLLINFFFCPELCSITRRVLYSPSTRKCSICGAKSLQPSNDDSLTNNILKHCCRCIYCGGGLLNS